MTGEPTEEVRLPGAIGAVRVGETIRKPSGPWTPTVQALLRFLRERGFDLAPEPLGLDEQGREVQSVMPGAPAYRPWPPVMLRVDGVERLATVLRRYHDLVRAYDPGPEPCWRAGCGPLVKGEIACHGDYGAWNTLWEGDRLVGVVDWDMTEPGLPIDDLGFLAIHAVPLRSDERARGSGFLGPVPRAGRLRAMCLAYEGFTPTEIVQAAARLHERDHRRTTEWGAEGREPWATFLASGDLGTIEDDASWLEAHGSSVAAEAEV